MLKKIVSLFIIVCLLPGCVFAQSKTLEKAQQESGFKLRDLNDNELSSQDLEGKPHIMLFWATWCPYCRGELNSLNKNYKQYQQENILVLPIDVGETPQKVNNFLSRNKLDFPVYLDRDSSVAKYYNVMGIPTYILIDKKGNIAYQGHNFPHKQYQSLLSE